MGCERGEARWCEVARGVKPERGVSLMRLEMMQDYV
jgi:hypothetical protein